MRAPFEVGNPGGPGNPKLRHLAALRTAIAECTTREQVLEVLDKLRELALAGDVTAGRVWLERVVGKEPLGELVVVDLPDVDCERAALSAQRLILRAAARGELSTEAASRLSAIASAAAEASVYVELRERLERLRQAGDWGSA